jgi:transcriptional repressor NrdR
MIRRRRECSDCGRRFTTYERATELQLFVVKKDGRREPFDREKIVAGMTKACEKRSIGREVIEETADRIARQARDQLSDEVSTSQIGAWVMEALRGIDDVAYVRFASVYKEFRDTDSFVKEIQSLAGNSPAPRHRTAISPQRRRDRKADAKKIWPPSAGTADGVGGRGPQSSPDQAELFGATPIIKSREEQS